MRDLLELNKSELEELRRFFSESNPQQTVSPNRPLSIFITLAGIALVLLSNFNPFGFQRDVRFLCGFFGVTVIAGGVVLLFIKVAYPAPRPIDIDNLLAQPEYEKAFRLVVDDQSTRGVVDEGSIQKGVDLLVAHGVAPSDALNNLCRVLRSFVDENDQV